MVKNPPALFPLRNGMEPVGNKKKLFTIGNHGGFTFIEVMIAMVVLGVGLLAIASMQITAIKGNGQASDITTATALIEEKLSGYKAMAYEDINDEEGEDGIFSWTTTVENNIPANGLKTITVKSSWTAEGDAHSLAFATVVSK